MRYFSGFVLKYVAGHFNNLLVKTQMFICLYLYTFATTKCNPSST